MNYTDACIFTGDRVITKAYAKINLTLDVVGRRKDGYHNLETIMQSISLFDLVIIDRMESEIKITTNVKYLPTNNKNIAYKAADLFFKETGIRSGAKILLHKNIPVGAGLAGGSTDAAAVLVGLNRLYGNPLNQKKLLMLGARIGADVPFCMIGGTALATGIGEKLEHLNNVSGLHVLVVKPKFGVSTELAYKSYDEAEDSIIERPNTEAMLRAIEKGNIKEISKNISNVFEKVVGRKYPIIRGIKSTMCNHGALAAEMSGSGSAVFGIFSSSNKADECAKLFYPDFDEVYTVTTL